MKFIKSILVPLSVLLVTAISCGSKEVDNSSMDIVSEDITLVDSVEIEMEPGVEKIDSIFIRYPDARVLCINRKYGYAVYSFAALDHYAMISDNMRISIMNLVYRIFVLKTEPATRKGKRAPKDHPRLSIVTDEPFLYVEIYTGDKMMTGLVFCAELDGIYLRLLSEDVTKLCRLLDTNYEKYIQNGRNFIKSFDKKPFAPKIIK